MKSIWIIIFFFVTSLTTYANGLKNYFENFNTQLTLIGESHLDDFSRDELAKSLKEFKKNGGEVLALEMIESSKQFLLDNFEEDFEGSTTDLANYLEVRWQYNTKSYMNLLEQARKVGLRLHAIDLSNEEWPQETTVYPVVPDISKVRIAREAHMAKVLCENKDLKTLVIIGSFHILERFLPNGLRKQCSLESKSLNLAEQVKN